jgi:hypothetical protein
MRIGKGGDLIPVLQRQPDAVESFEEHLPMAGHQLAPGVHAAARGAKPNPRGSQVQIGRN